jgi:hypothetical protein
MWRPGGAVAPISSGVQLPVQPKVLTSLSTIPPEPTWSFPSLTFDRDGYIMTPDWVSDLLTEDQKKIQNVALVDVCAANSTNVDEEWNTFQLAADLTCGDDTELMTQIQQQNSVAVLIQAIRGH